MSCSNNETAASDSALPDSTQPLLGVVPVHPPKFPDLLRFMRSIESCGDAARAIDLLVIFTNASDSQAFRTLHAARGLTRGFGALVLDHGLPAQVTGKGRRLSQTKSTDDASSIEEVTLELSVALGQVKTELQHARDEVASLRQRTSELERELANRDFASEYARGRPGPTPPVSIATVASNLSSLHRAAPWQRSHVVTYKRWYGLAQLFDSNGYERIDGASTSWIGELRTRYAYTLFLDSETAVADCSALRALPGRVRAKHEGRVWPSSVSCVPKLNARMIVAALQTARNATEMAILKTATQGLRAYPWWTELPFAHVDDVEAILRSWRERATSLLGVPPPAGNVYSYREAVARVKPGHGVSFSSPRTGHVVGYPFDHMIVVCYWLLHRGWRLLDLTARLDKQHRNGDAGFLSRMTQGEWPLLAPVMQPMWVPPHLCALWASSPQAREHALTPPALVYGFNLCAEHGVDACRSLRGSFVTIARNSLMACGELGKPQSDPSFGDPVVTSFRLT